MSLLPWIALGGALGAMARFGLTALATEALGPRLPWGTLLVNVVGSLLLGMLMAWGDRAPMGQGVRVMLTTGVMGALTTFSTFSVETVRLVERGDWLWAGANVLGNVVLSLAAAAIGLAIVGRTSG